jgi:glycosyltransferase involved in cell wall biosynthesis
VTDGRPLVAVVCADAAGNGGVAAVSRRHAEELAREFRVLLVSRELPAGLEQKGVEGARVRSAGFEWARRLGHAPRVAWFAAKAAMLLHRRNETDSLSAVICEGHVEAAVLARTLGRHRSVPVVVVCHGDVFNRPAGTYDPVLTALYKVATVVAYHECDRVVVLSPVMRDWALAGGALRGRIELIPNGISPEDIGLSADLEGLRRERPDDEPLRILFVGRLSVEKGVEDLVDACHLLRGLTRMPFHLSIVGTGPRRGELEKRVADLGLSEGVSFRGPIPRADLGAHYLEADVVCVPSLSDPLPGVVLEAMSAGAAVVATGVDGIPWMIEDGVCGILVPPRNPSAFAASLASLSSSSTLRRALGRAARARSATDFGWATCGERIRHVARRLTTPARDEPASKAGR